MVSSIPRRKSKLNSRYGDAAIVWLPLANKYSKKWVELSTFSHLHGQKKKNIEKLVSQPPILSVWEKKNIKWTIKANRYTTIP